jgi:predicted amidohydrolase
MALARELDMAIGVGLIECADDGGLFNYYVFCQPDGTFACHRKLHAFENEHIRSGDRYTVIDSPLGVRIGILICYDNNPGRERSCDCPAWRGYSPRTTSDRRLRLA